MNERKLNGTYPSQIGAQAQSGNGQQTNGSNGQHDSDQDQRYGKGEFFLGPKLALLDTQLGALAFRVLCYGLSKGNQWRFRSWQVKQQFGCGKVQLQTAMRELREAGYARLLKTGGGYRKACGQFWEIRKSASQPWTPDPDTPLKNGKFESIEIRPSKNDAHKKERSLKKENTIGISKRGVTEQHGREPASLRLPLKVADPQSLEATSAEPNHEAHSNGNGERISSAPAKIIPVREPADEHGYELRGKFYSESQANELAMQSPDPNLALQFRKAIRQPDGAIRIAA